jgi:hypothetical protein
MEKVIKAIEELEEAQKQQTRTLQKLKRSLQIKALWPAAFDHGSVTTHVQGNPRRALIFTIIRGDESQRQFPLTDVPLALWPAQVLADMARPGANAHYKQLLKEGKCTTT